MYIYNKAVQFYSYRFSALNKFNNICDLYSPIIELFRDEDYQHLYWQITSDKIESLHDMIDMLSFRTSSMNIIKKKREFYRLLKILIANTVHEEVKVKTLSNISISLTKRVNVY